MLICVIKGSYADVLSSVGLPSEFLSPLNSRKALMDQINLDLYRTNFVPSSGMNFSDWIKALQTESVDLAYTQGNIDAGVFPNCIFSTAMPEVKKNELRFSYMDSEGLLSGFCLVCNEEDPNVWCVSIIHNAAAAPIDRKVSVYCHPSLMKAESGLRLEAAEVFPTLLEDIDAPDVCSLLCTNGGIIQLLYTDSVEKLQVNLENLEQLSERVSNTEILHKFSKIVVDMVSMENPPCIDTLEILLIIIVKTLNGDIQFLRSLSDEEIEQLRSEPMKLTIVKQLENAQAVLHQHSEKYIESLKRCSELYTVNLISISSMVAFEGLLESDGCMEMLNLKNLALQEYIKSLSLISSEIYHECPQLSSSLTRK